MFLAENKDKTILNLKGVLMISKTQFQKKVFIPSDNDVGLNNERNLELDVVVIQGGGQLRIWAVHLAPDLDRSSVAERHDRAPNRLQRDLNKIKFC